MASTDLVHEQLNDNVLAIASAVAAVMACAQGQRIVEPENCAHQLTVGWKPGKAICVLCREAVANPDGAGIRITRLPSDPIT